MFKTSNKTYFNWPSKSSFSVNICLIFDRKSSWKASSWSKWAQMRTYVFWTLCQQPDWSKFSNVRFFSTPSGNPTHASRLLHIRCLSQCSQSKRVTFEEKGCKKIFDPFIKLLLVRNSQIGRLILINLTSFSHY